MLSESVYRSVFHPDLDGLIPLKIYLCAFPERKMLYLVEVAKPGPVVPRPADWTELELVMSVPEFPELLFFAHTDHENPGTLDKALVPLFLSVKKAFDSPLLSPVASAIINDYLR